MTSSGTATPVFPSPVHIAAGREVERWMIQFREAWGELAADPVELVEEGDNVVALVHMTGRGRGSGVEVRGGVDVHVISFTGDAISYFRIYPGNFLVESTEVTDEEFELLILRVQEGLEVPEVAGRLGIEERTARGMLDHVRQLLRELPESGRVS